MNVLSVGALLEDDTLLKHLAPSWKPIYEVALAGISGRPPDDAAPQFCSTKVIQGTTLPPHTLRHYHEVWPIRCQQLPQDHMICRGAHTPCV